MFADPPQKQMYYGKSSALAAHTVAAAGPGSYGLSWQIVPSLLSELIGGPDRVGANRAMQAMLKMSKLEVARLEAAYSNRA